MQRVRGLALVCALCTPACAFEPADLPGIPGPQTPDAASPRVMADAASPGVEPDAGLPGVMPDAALPDAAPPAPPLCDPADPALVGCFAFEDSVSDESGAALDVSVSDVSYDEGVQGRAVVLAADSALHVAETPALDFGAFTIEMWVRPDALPAGSDRAALFDNDGQYSVFIFDDATVRCSGNGEVRQEGVLTVGAWTHVACVHDGQSITLFVDGQVRLTGAATPPNTDVDNGSNIGANSPDGNDEFRGRIDALRIWNRARTPDEVCAAAGCASR